MTRRVLSRLTYSNIMSTLAVFLLLGGVSYAAATLAANSVGKRELKDNAVTSAEVKDKSLKAGDFLAGQLPAGPQGKQGPKGDPGAPDPSDLLDPTTDLPNGWIVLEGDGFSPPLLRAFRLDCPSTCTLAIAGAADVSPQYHAWFEAAQLDPASAEKNVDLIVYDYQGVEAHRYEVTGAVPVSRYDNGKRFVLLLAAESIQHAP